jgi:hypothetical protein
MFGGKTVGRSFGVVLVQDTRAFVEIFEVPRKDKRAHKRRRRALATQVDALRARLDVRLFERSLEAMERAAAADRADDTDAVATPGRSRAPSDRDLKAVKAGLARALTTAQRKSARARLLEQDLEERDRNDRVTRWYRLHTEFRHFEWSEQRFAGLAGTQRSRPVRMAVNGHVRWWWYLDRFWCEDEGLGSEQVRALVLDGDRQRLRRRRSEERALVDALTYEPEAPTSPREPVGGRPARGAEGRCVDCGSRVDVVFDAIAPARRGGNGVASLAVELRCVSCRERRQGLEAEPRPSRARDAEPRRPWRHDELLLDEPAEDAEPTDLEEVSSGGILPVVWVVSPDDVHARHA